MDTKLCRIGGLACVDNPPASAPAPCVMATGEPYCMSSDMCNSTAPDCSTIGSTCFTMSLSNTLAIHCGTPLTLQDGSPCTQDTQSGVSLTSVTPTCTNVMIAPVAMPLGFKNMATLGTSILMVDSQSPCAVSLTLTPGNATPTEIPPGLVDIDTGTAHLVIPIVFFVSTLAASCELQCYIDSGLNPASNTIASCN